jgi:hypothetical protein
MIRIGLDLPETPKSVPMAESLVSDLVGDGPKPLSLSSAPPDTKEQG